MSVNDAPLTYEQARSNAERIVDADLKERVVRGMELLLKEYGPDWPDLIDPSELLMDNPTECVLGQLYDRHTLTAAQRAELKHGWGHKPDVAVPGFFKALVIIDGAMQVSPSKFGFDAQPDDTGGSNDEQDYSDLTEAWMVVLGAEDEF